MENNSFEQQFIQDVKASTPPVVQGTEQSHAPLVILIVIIFFMVLQLILSVVILAQLSSSSNEYDSEEITFIDESTIEPDEGLTSVYDENDYLIAIDAICKSGDTTITLTKDNTYQKLGPSSSTPSKGTYSITRGSVFRFSGPQSDESMLFYDGYALTDGTIFYECESTS